MALALGGAAGGRGPLPPERLPPRGRFRGGAGPERPGEGSSGSAANGSRMPPVSRRQSFLPWRCLTRIEAPDSRLVEITF